MPPRAFAEEIRWRVSAAFRQIRSRPPVWLSDWLSTHASEADLGKSGSAFSCLGRLWSVVAAFSDFRCTALHSAG